MWIGRANVKLGMKESVWANPYRIGVHGDRRQVVDHFCWHLRDAGMQGRLYELGGRTLVCSCRRDQACHADVIMQYWDETMQQQTDILQNLKKMKVLDHRQESPPEPPRPAPPPRPPEPPGTRVRPSAPASSTHPDVAPQILLVELFAGIGTATFAANRLGVPTLTMAVEKDRDLRNLLAKRHGVQKQDLTEDVRATKSKDIYGRARQIGNSLKAIIIVAGPPCVDVAKVNKQRAGFTGERTNLATEAIRIADEVGKLAEEDPWPVVLLMENVMQQDSIDRRQFENLMQTPTIGIHGGDWGWVHRSRLFWIRCCQPGPRAAQLRRVLGQPDQWALPPDVRVQREGRGWLLRYTGPRVPAQVEWEAGYQPLHLGDHPGVTTKFLQSKVTYDSGRFCALTKEFPHPPDCVSKNTHPKDIQRFKRDGGRFPVATYKRGNLLWTQREDAGGAWRTKTPTENEQIMGLPAGATEPLKTAQRRNTAIGNSIHVPMLATILYIIIAQTCPDTLAKVEGNRLTATNRTTQTELPIQPSRQRRPEKIAQAIAAGQQPTGKAIGQLIPDGLGYVGFLKAIRTIEHPIEQPPKLAAGIVEAIGVIQTKGDSIKQWRETQMRKVRDMAWDLEPQRQAWANRLHPRIRRVIGHLHVPLIDWMVRATDHADQDYVQSLCEGRNVVGDIGRSYLYPEDHKPATIDVESWAANPGGRNRKILANIQATGDNELDEMSWEKTQKEISKGYCRILEESEYDLDACCITGRFPKWERKADGTMSVRNISNWRESEGNAATSMSERYMPDDLTTAYNHVRVLKEVFGQDVILNAYKCDWAMAFRQTPTHPSQAHLTLEATWDPHNRRAVVMEVFGQPFGGKGSQYNFIRDPAALVHFGRKFLALLVAHYSDDTWAIEPESTSQQSYELWTELHRITGWQLDLGKSPPPGRMCMLLGAEVHVGWTQPFAQNTPDRLDHIKKECQRHLTQGTLTPAEAAHLAGTLGFASTLWWGKKGRASLQPLRVRQYYRSPTTLNRSIEACLHYWVRETAKPQTRSLLTTTDPLTLHVTVTDGEGTGWIGLLYLRPRERGWRPQATRVRLPDEWRASWQSTKTTDINEVEAASAPVALCTWPELTDGLWIHFTDNSSAEATLAKGSSKANDMNVIAEYTWTTAAERRLYLWADRVSTKDNPTDGLSRGNYEQFTEDWEYVRAHLPALSFTD